MKTVRYSNITRDDYERVSAWRVPGDMLDEDPEMVPALRTTNGALSKSMGAVWCRVNATFADGTEVVGIALCRADAPEEPSLWQFWEGERLISLNLPPAPPFVLDKHGPAVLAREFRRTVGDVFPMVVEAVDDFEHPPRRRSVTLTQTGPAGTRESAS